jgi:hypothetical protein
MRKLSFTLCVCFAAALAAARPAAAQEVTAEDQELVRVLSAQVVSQCRRIPIILKGNGELSFPPVATAKVGQCICWQSNKNTWSVDFPFGSPFFEGKRHFEKSDACGDVWRSGFYKYDVDVAGVTEDPWLDID